VVLVFLIAAGIWVLAWVVLIVVALVRILFPNRQMRIGATAPQDRARQQDFERESVWIAAYSARVHFEDAG
jgi:hypothetical protein